MSPSGPDAGKRVALLARAGAAREHLRAALHEAGANLVLEEDPNALDAQAMAAASAQVILVALEPAVEDGLSRFDDLLSDPAVMVIFDEADLAAKREGWEAQRFARHLAAKLNGHADVLPPGRELEASQPEPGLPRTPEALHAHARIDTHLEEAQEVASALPHGGLEPPVSPKASGLSLLSLESQDRQPAASSGRFEPPVTHQAPAPAAAGGLSLESESPPPVAAEAAAGVRGAAVMFAGIGGPDAVRKVLADLPPDFPRPVLVQLRLDGGRYDNLVKQMARVSTLPVLLAKAGEAALAAHVYVLPDNVAIAVGEGAVRFEAGALRVDQLIASLPAAESAVLLLSGSDPAQVEPALALSALGGFVAGQALQGCYDPAASKALVSRGGVVAAPDELSALMAQHWAH